MKRKSIQILTTTLLLSTMLSFSSLAAWEQQTDGAWKYKDDTTNVYVTSQWIESASEKGLWYYVDQNGIMATNTLIDDLYYVNELGEWREGQTDGSNQGNIDKSKLGHDLDDWEYSGGSVEDILGKDTANSLAEALDRVR